MSEKKREEPVYYDRIPDHGMRLVNEVGGAFWLGLAGSSAFNLFRGLRAVAARAPRAAGSLAAYFAVCTAVESAVSAARRKDQGLDNRWNVLAGGGAAWAALGAHRGAVGTACLGLGWVLEMMECHYPDWYKDAEDTPQRTRPLPAAAPARRGWRLLGLGDPAAAAHAHRARWSEGGPHRVV